MLLLHQSTSVHESRNFLTISKPQLFKKNCYCGYFWKEIYCVKFKLIFKTIFYGNRKRGFLLVLIKTKWTLEPWAQREWTNAETFLPPLREACNVNCIGKMVHILFLGKDLSDFDKGQIIMNNPNHRLGQSISEKARLMVSLGEYLLRAVGGKTTIRQQGVERQRFVTQDVSRGCLMWYKPRKGHKPQ